jgi:hypothetical protein
MFIAGWKSLMRLYRHLRASSAGPRLRGGRRRKSRPVIESLEPISLLSAGGSLKGAASAHRLDARAHRIALPVDVAGTRAGVPPAAATPVTLPPQTATLADTSTNFANDPLSPPLNLFNPSLGTLLSVTLIHSATLTSNITSQNLSPTSGTVITASLAGSYQINGLNETISQPPRSVTSAPVSAGVFGSGTDTVTFPPLQLNDNGMSTFSDAASLAFFTASTGRTTITPTMTANASAAASAPNGNLFTATQTTATSTVTVSYTYLPPSCPGVGPIGRIGVHHQRPLLIVPFIGPVDPALAANPRDYHVITRTGQRIPVISATYDPATNSTTLRLRPSELLNVHHRLRLAITLPCPDGIPDEHVTIPFGTKYSLIGFHDHQGRFVPVRNGKISHFGAGARARRSDSARPTRPRA